MIFEKDIPALGEEEVVANFDDDYENFVSSSESIYNPHPRSILKHHRNDDAEIKFKQTLTVNRSLLKSNQRQLEANCSHFQINELSGSSQSLSSSISTPISPSVLVSSSPSPEQPAQKFRQTLNFKRSDNLVFNEHTMRIFKKKIKAINKKRAQQQTIKEKKKKRKKHRRSRSDSFKRTSSKNNTTSHEMNFLEPKTSLMNYVNSGEIIRVEKAMEESDVDVDIMSNESDDEIVQIDSNEVEIEEVEDDVSVEVQDTVDDVDGNWIETPTNDLQILINTKLQQLAESDRNTFRLLENTGIPTVEMRLDPNYISDLEKFMHAEFFVGRPTKTPERFLKIRNHIVNMWLQSKTYISKTAARHGLKKCGDVNCISRIHLLLEQLAAINFECPEVDYIRPLKVVYEMFQTNIRNRGSGGPQSYRIEKTHRSRNRSNNEEFPVNDGNYTISHIEGVPRPDLGVVPSPSQAEQKDSMINRIKSRTMSRTQFELVKCQRFSKDNEAPFKVTISLSCLLCLHLHALSSHLEIMGFLGGHISKNSGRDKLALTRYKPCRTSNQTPINCEMCPISQVQQSLNLIEEGYDLLGWFHSHPLFPPIPSRTDLKTQTEMQMQFSSNNPFIGFILSCMQFDFK